jgi:23S rRNA pseudouridine955/2504/2580 synthase
VAQEIIVPAAHAGRKLEGFLLRRFPVGYVHKLFRNRGVRVNGRRANKLDVVRCGDRVELFIPFAATTRAPLGAQYQVQILFENSDLLVVNKPAELAVHEAKNIPKSRTLLGALESRFRQASFKPVLVHRLDKETSGVLLVAKSEEVARELESLFSQTAVAKQYSSLVVGRLPQSSGVITFDLAGREGKPVRATTRYRVEKRFADETLVQVQIDTGRMHQIRLHFAQLGYPVVMDSQHGDFSFNKRFRKRTGLKRQFLHAARLAIRFRGKDFSWQAPLPQDLRQTLEILESENA